MVLYLCWDRELKLQRAHRQPCRTNSTILALNATELVRRINRERLVVEASDGHSYSIRFPNEERELALCTEVICFEIARLIGLPVPPVRVIVVNRSLACRAGILHGHGGSARESIPCLGVRELVDGIRPRDDTRLGLPIKGAKGSRYLAGANVLNILTMNSFPEYPSFRVVNGHTEPFFKDFCHALKDADWFAFLRARRYEPLPNVFGEKVGKYEQLEPWVKRLQQLEFNDICELAVKVPQEWYGNKPSLVIDVIRKLETRCQDIKACILHAVR